MSILDSKMEDMEMISLEPGEEVEIPIMEKEIPGAEIEASIEIKNTRPKKEPKIFKYIGMPNVADDLEKEELEKISTQVMGDFEEDKYSREERDKRIIEYIKLSKQTSDHKSHPWENASNVKYPLLTSSAIQFAAKAYPLIVQNGNICKGKIYGKDYIEKPVVDQQTGQPAIDQSGNVVTKKVSLNKQEKADRVSEFINWQLNESICNWEEDMDKMCNILPIVGCMFKKVYYDAVEDRPGDVLINPLDIYIRYDTRSITKNTRITHAFEMTYNEILERVNMGLYLEDSVKDISDKLGDDGILSLRESIDNYDTRDYDGDYFLILEQHTLLDLDNDGYKEPYIVTMLSKNRKVLRIVPRYRKHNVYVNDKGEVAYIDPDCYFVKYGFIPSPDGSVYDIGFGDLLYPLNECINTIINQLIDAGTLSNTSGGLIGGNLKIKSGALKFRPGEYKRVDSFGGTIRDNIYEFNFKEPSGTLFQLMQALIGSSNEITSIKDILPNDLNMNAAATTVMAMIEQGVASFKSIYKRLHRSLKEELKLIYKVDREFVSNDLYSRVLDDESASIDNDFGYKDYDIVPVSDPASASDIIKLTRAQSLIQFKDDPMIDQKEIRIRYLKSLGIDDVDKIVIDPPAPQPDPIAMQRGELELEVIKLQASTAAKQVEYIQKQIDKLESDMIMDQDKFMLDKRKIDSEIEVNLIRVESEALKKTADSIEAVARAEGREVGTQNYRYIQQLEQGKEVLVNEPAREQEGLSGGAGLEGIAERGAMESMEAPSNEQNVLQVPGGLQGVNEQVSNGQGDVGTVLEGSEEQS